MEITPKTSIFSIWVSPRKAIRYYSAKQTHKLEHLMVLLASLASTSVYAFIDPTKLGIVLLSTFVGCYLYLLITAYLGAGLYTITARWLKGKGRYKDNRLVFLLGQIAAIPISFMWIPAYLKMDLDNPAFIPNLFFGLCMIPVFAFSIYLITLNIRYASEMNRFSKTRAFFAGIVASLLSTLAIIALAYPIAILFQRVSA